MCKTSTCPAIYFYFVEKNKEKEKPQRRERAMRDKEQTAIQRLREASEMSLFRYKQPIVIADSGGKDSSVCKELALRAGIPFEVEHNHTTADAPETVYFVRREFARLEEKGIPCKINYPYYKGKRTSMWALIPQKLIPPTRVVRWCCSILKERSCQGRFIVTGVRWAESMRRRNSRGIYERNAASPARRIILNNDNDEKRRLFESCTLKAKFVCNPIIDWTDSDVWDFLMSEKIPHNPLYGEGMRRVGCIACPMASKSRKWELARWPAYERMYIRAFERMLEERWRRGKLDGFWRIGTTGRDIMHWWLEDGILPGQLSFDDFIEVMDDE